MPELDPVRARLLKQLQERETDLKTYVDGGVGFDARVSLEARQE